MKLFKRGGLFLVLVPAAATAAFAYPTSAAPANTVVIYDGAVTSLSATMSGSDGVSLWVTLPDLTRATGFELKPQGVCRKELCFPLPKNRKNEFLARRGKLTWFNLSEFARLLHEPVAHDEKLAVWYFGPRPDTQNRYLESFMAPDFTLPDLNGKPHSLFDFRGKKVLLLTWASW